jgi:type I restriction enzyme S subunit
LPTDIDREFLARVLRRKETVDAAMQEKTGSRMPRANMDKLFALEIPLPPLDEQRRIASRLNEQLATVESARKAAEEQLQAARQLPSAYLREVFDNKNNRWTVKSMSEVCEIIMGQSPEGTSYNANGEGYPLLNGPTEFGEEYPTPIQWTTSPTRFAEKGDILFCVRGATTGRKNIADQRYCIGRGLAAIRAKERQAVTPFLFFLLDTITLTLLKQTAGSTFPNLPGDKLKGFKVKIPPIIEQERIVSELNKKMKQVDKIVFSLESQLAEINRLPASLLREAFAGRMS